MLPIPALQIVYEDDVLLVCHKPAGLMVEPDRNNHPNLLQQVKQYVKAQTGEVLPYTQHLHRLDRVTSGIVLFTKQKEHLRFLSEQFAQGQVSKQYEALTSHSPLLASGILEHWHRKEKKKAVLVSADTPFADRARLEYHTSALGAQVLWHITLHTGKYHQIRVQLASIQCPIIGDSLYGSTEAYHDHAIALHAAQLRITHPITLQLMEFEVPAPWHAV